MFEKEEAKGLVVIGVTDEPPELVDKWVAKYEPAYPIVSVRGDEFDDFLGVKYFPFAAVIAPDGTVSFAGSAGESSSPLGDAMKKAEKGSLYPKKLGKAVKLFRDGKLDKSYGELTSLLAKSDKLSEEERTAAESFKTYLEGQASQALETGKQKLEGGLVYVAVAAVAPFAEADPAFPATEDCRAFLKELEALPRYGDEMKGGELHREARAHSDGMEYSDAIEVYKTILKKYEGTKIAAVAQEEAKDLISKGMVGYKKVCPECQKANRACARHHEEADL